MIEGTNEIRSFGELRPSVSGNKTTTRHNCSAILVCMIWLLVALSPAPAPAQTGEYDVKAVALSRIAQYIEWPEQADQGDDSGTFVISVLGQNPFGSALEDAYLSREQKIKNRRVEIRYLEDIDDIDGCHILFISCSEKDRLDDILSHTEGQPLLTIGDTEGFGESGVHINFYLAKGKIRFELNEMSAEVAGFHVDFRLRNIARIVGRERGDG